ncbi:MAG: hypothetical protein KAT29_08775, partial [Anaerolineales bacterium]|nr:hypothetical protein [Anaerolineales bacterium]
RALRLLNFNGERCMLIYGVTGDKSKAKNAYHDTNALIRSNGGLPTGQTIGNTWEKSRFTAPYLRNTLWEVGYAVDTLESVFNWSRLGEALSSIKSSIQTALHDDNEQILVFSHLSHFYPDGASIYITYIFRRSPDPDEMLYRWKKIKNKASISIIELGGTISHHHGVGTDHTEYLQSEKGSVGMAALSGIINSFDPERLLNPGKLLVH